MMENNIYKNISERQKAHLQKKSGELRLETIKMLYDIGMEYKGHPGPALSLAEIIACLYFYVLKIDPLNPKWQERDRVILSKGHACPILYVALAKRGFFDESNLKKFRHIDSMLQGHPDMRKIPGVDMTAGSLGNGLGAGVGMALSCKMDKKEFHTYVILGDGEMQEGLVWEAAMTAGNYKLNNLTAIIDKNGFQSCDTVEGSCDIEPLKSKLDSFKWEVKEIDGHNIEEILIALEKQKGNRPLAIIANTIKGKGLSFMENDNKWHQRVITRDDYEMAINELEMN